MSRFFRGRRASYTSILAIASLLPTLACGSGTSSAEAKKLDIDQVENGFGLMLPHLVKVLNSPNPSTAPIVEIRTVADAKNNITATNPVLPVITWPTEAKLPGGAAGNHYIAIHFTSDLNKDSILDPTSPSAPNYGFKIDSITGDAAIKIQTVNYSNPLLPIITNVPGRAFINGYTAVNGTLTRVVSLNSAGQPVAVAGSVGVGFPGTGGNFSGANKLVRPDTLVFVADSDGSLSSFETFPTAVQIRIEISNDATTGVKATNGKTLIHKGVVASTVGPDTYPPEVQLVSTNPVIPDIDPSNGASNIDPLTKIKIHFSEPIQPLWLGSFFKANATPTLSSSITLTSGSQSAPTTLTYPFSVDFVDQNVYDFSSYELTPALNFPGALPPGIVVPTAVPLNYIKVAVNTAVGDLITTTGGGSPVNVNTQAHQIVFQTGVGPGLVNAPVAPEAIYIARNGAEGGISVLDLNGFGASTGDPTNNLDNLLDATDVSKFHFNPYFPFNQGGGINPPMVDGNTTLDGGSAGVFTLTKDTSLSDRLFTATGTITDMHLGQALDRVFNNATFPLGTCLSGGNPCANSSLQTTVGNSIANRPIINPPRLNPNPSSICLSPQIIGEDPTTAGLTALVPGDAFGIVGFIPPSGVVYSPYGTVNGPQAPQQNPNNCTQAFGMRQQIGHFLYVVDNTNKKLLILNSNRMTLIDSISLPDPVRIGFSPDLKVLGVTNFATGTVSFIGVDPFGSNFHQVYATKAVGEGPTGIAWQPDLEDILVCNTLGNSITIMNALDLAVRKTLNNQIVMPIDMSVTPRSANSGLYNAYILNGNGTIAMFESGPSVGPQAIGFDEVVGTISENFPQATHITPGYDLVEGDAWVTHQTPDGTPRVSREKLLSAPGGAQPLNPGQGNTNFFTPGFRTKVFGTAESITSTDLSGNIPVDIAFDDLVNNGNMATGASAYSGFNQNAAQDGKHPWRNGAPVSFEHFVFIAFQDVGKVDVIQRSTMKRFMPSTANDPGGAGQQAFKGFINTSGVAVLCHYWRQ